MYKEYIKIAKDFVIKNPAIGVIGVFCLGFPLFVVYKLKIDTITNNKENFPKITNFDNRFKKFQQLKNNNTKKSGKLLG